MHCIIIKLFTSHYYYIGQSPIIFANGVKMVGKKGRSGRKPNETGRVMRAVALYIPMYNLDSAHLNAKQAKNEWYPEDWFRQFKRINGNKWQERVRTMIAVWTNNYEEHNMWPCECSGRLKKWHFQHEGVCHRCKYVPGELERYKTIAEVNKHVWKPKDETPLVLCPTHNKPLKSELRTVAGVESKVLKCEDCK